MKRKGSFIANEIASEYRRKEFYRKKKEIEKKKELKNKRVEQNTIK